MLTTFIQTNFMAFMILSALIIIMIANRKSNMPEAGLFKMAIILVTCLIAADCIDKVAVEMVEAGRDQPRDRHYQHPDRAAGELRGHHGCG